MSRTPIIAGCLLALSWLAACSRLPQSPGESPITVSIGSRSPAGKSLIDFENQPANGSSGCAPGDPLCTPIANPLVMEGVSFSDPAVLATGFCSAPTCEPDPNNADGGNVELFLNPGGTIDFPQNTAGATLTLEGIGDNPFHLSVTDGAGNHRVIDGVGESFDQVFVGVSSPHGIARVEVIGVGGTGGPLAISAVFSQRRGGLSSL